MMFMILLHQLNKYLYTVLWIVDPSPKIHTLCFDDFEAHYDRYFACYILYMCNISAVNK